MALDEDFSLRGETGKNSGIKRQTREKVGNFAGSFLSVPKAAKALGVDPKTVKSWCETGKLPAMAKPYGKTVTYLISPQALELFSQAEKQKDEHKKASRISVKPHVDYLPKWKMSMAKGLLKGKAYSQRTIDDYERYATLFFSKHKDVSVSALKKELMAIPSEHFAKREHYYKALLCFGRFLIRENALDAGFLEDMKPLYPKRHLPQKRFTVDKQEIISLLDACESLQERLVMSLLVNTGLRASESCALQWADIDFEKGILIVRCGKGGKERRVGLLDSLMELLRKHQEEASKPAATHPVLLNRLNQQMDASGLFQRIQRIGKRVGLKASPHALRRAFVTINAGKGRPLVYLQRACGHSDIKTTMSYCRTTEQEVIEAMKGWD